MKRKFSFLITYWWCLLLGLLGLLVFITGNREGGVSELENRTLEPLPAFSAESWSRETRTRSAPSRKTVSSWVTGVAVTTTVGSVVTSLVSASAEPSERKTVQAVRSVIFSIREIIPKDAEKYVNCM